MTQHGPDTGRALAYAEPSVQTILIQSSFLLSSNLFNSILDALLYCGLIGQILVCVAWGSPGAQLLSRDAENAVVQFGYLGLILIVYEGGLATDLRALRANLWLYSAVALTGIALPIALSFVLQPLTGAAPIQCFAAGAALCSTSLGTTFTVLRSTSLSHSRLGVVLTSAAMLDDVIGLVMVQVVANLDSADASIAATTILRPVLVSLTFAVLAPAACRLLLKPGALALHGYRRRHGGGWIDKLARRRSAALLVHTLLLAGMVAGASYAGTSNLFAAYIAGAVISWWGGTELDPPTRASPSMPADPRREPSTSGASSGSSQQCHTSGQQVFHCFYEAVLLRVLQPFFCSIGFSIPITSMFAGSIVWRGIVYAALMCLGKLACGLWLMLTLWDGGSRSPPVETRDNHRQRGDATPASAAIELETRPKARPSGGKGDAARSRSKPTGATATSSGRAIAPNDGLDASSPHDPAAGERTARTSCVKPEARAVSTKPSPASRKPLSLYPAAILGCAMVARGEIGFLISSVAQSSGIFGQARESGRSDIFLVVTWAIVLCTILGPLSCGALVRRVKTLESRRAGGGGGGAAGHDEARGPGRDVLGDWVRSSKRTA